MALVVKETRKVKKVFICGGCGKDTHNGSGFCDNCNAPDIFDNSDGKEWKIFQEEEEKESSHYPEEDE